MKDWLSLHMLKQTPGKACEVAAWLGKHANHKSHSRFLHRDDLEDHGLKIVHLESDQKLQDAVLSVFHAYSVTFAGTSVTKIMENDLGKTFLQMAPPVAPPPPSPFQIPFGFGPIPPFVPQS